MWTTYRGTPLRSVRTQKFETASTIKAFILAALYLQVSRGKASLEEEITYEESQFVDGSGMLRALGAGAKLKVKDTATMMIICSDNIATNMIIDYLGLDTINACIRELGILGTPSCTIPSTLTATTSWAPPRPPGLRRPALRRWPKGHAGQQGSQCCHAGHLPPAALQHHADPRVSPSSIWTARRPASRSLSGWPARAAA